MRQQAHVRVHMLGTQGLLAQFQSVVARSSDPVAIVQGIMGPLAGKELADDATVVVVRYWPAHGHLNTE